MVEVQYYWPFFAANFHFSKQSTNKSSVHRNTKFWFFSDLWKYELLHKYFLRILVCFSAQMKDSFSALTCLRGGRFSVIHKYVTSEKLLKGNSFTDIFHGFCLLCRENSFKEHRLITASCLYLCIIKYLYILNMM